MAETKVAYVVEVTKQGDGAKAAAEELQALGRTATATNAGLANISASSTAAKKGFDVFKGTLSMVAGQAFPQLTNSVMIAKNAIEGLRASNQTLTASFATVAGGVAGLAAALLTAYTQVQVWIAEHQQNKSASALSWQETEIQKALIEEINRLEKTQEITKQAARAMRNATGDSAGNSAVQSYLRYRNESDPNQVIGDLQRQSDLVQSIVLLERERKNIKTDHVTIAQDEDRAMKLYSDTLQTINSLEKEGLLTKKQADALADLAAIKQNTRLTQLEAEKNKLDEINAKQSEQVKDAKAIADMMDETKQSFASGFATAFVDFASGTKTAKEAFSDFARSFLQDTARMIMQYLVLKAISGIGGMLAADGGMYPSMMAAGGVRFAADGLTGVNSVSQPTYFPRFNVVAGEAGREMLTVLARPRMMEVGGMQAVVGSAQGNRLAITSADALAQAGSGGAGGTIVIQVQGTPDFEARVISNSVKGAQVQVANDMRADTPISRGVKGLTS